VVDGASVLLSTAEASEPRSLNRLVTEAARQVPGCSGAAAVLWREGEAAAVAASHPALPALIEVQLRCGRGPMLDVLAAGEPAGCADTLEELSWPEYAGTALRQGVRCSLSLAHRSGSEDVCLSMYGARPRTLGADSVAAAERLLAVGRAAVGIASEYGHAQRTARQLRDAAESRSVVDQAKGVLMHAFGCSADEALRRMRQVSQERNMRVTDVAMTIISSGGGARLGL
jgi:ANTAR domain